MSSQLGQDNNIEQLDLGLYLDQVCRDLQGSGANCVVDVTAQPGITIATDRAISAALIVCELITNAVKYAYSADGKGTISVSVGLLEGSGSDALLTVRDAGTGLPPGFDAGKSAGLGMRIIAAFCLQLDAKMEARPQNPGTEFRIVFPVASRQARA